MVRGRASGEEFSPDVPFGLVIAELKNYLDCALPSDYGAQIAADHSLLDTSSRSPCARAPCRCHPGRHRHAATQD